MRVLFERLTEGQEVAVFGYQVLGSGPFGVGSDEGVAALEVLTWSLILSRS